MKTNDKKQTLLQVVVNSIKKSSPEVLKLPEQFSSVSRAKKCKLTKTHSKYLQIIIGSCANVLVLSIF